MMLEIEGIDLKIEYKHNFLDRTKTNVPYSVTILFSSPEVQDTELIWGFTK